jgi:hypothetical protein
MKALGRVYALFTPFQLPLNRILMLDLFYIAITLAFFVACWYLVKACEKL